jgi:acetyl-CoA C-acetyltransferase
MANTDIVIVGAARTAVGSFNGAFANTPAHDLGKAAIQAAMQRAGVEGGEVDEVILGQILTAGQGQNPARQAAMNAGVPKEKTAWGLNQLCGSGLRAVAIGMQQIANGDADIIVAGGQESMSQAPHAAYMRSGTKMGDFKLVDTMLKDGLMDAFNGYHMGNTAENVAQKWQLTARTRTASRSHRRTRPRRPRRRGVSRTRSRRSPFPLARATSWSTRTNTSGPAPRSRRSES